jgi:hypothetical protein
MKNTGVVSKGFSRVLLALATIRNFFTSSPSYSGGSQAYSDRSSFYGVSAGRQHNVKNRHPL